MERAFEFVVVAYGAGRAQLGATMQTGVVVRADVVGGNARDDERVRSKVVDVVVTDFRDVLFAACELPGFLPQRLELALGIRRVDVAILGNVLVTEEFVRFGANPARGGNFIGRNDVLRAWRAGTAGIALLEFFPRHGGQIGRAHV